MYYVICIGLGLLEYFVVTKCTKFVQLIDSQYCCHQMSDFKAKMHRIRFRLGLRPRPRWGAYSAPQTPYSWI